MTKDLVRELGLQDLHRSVGTCLQKLAAISLVRDAFSGDSMVQTIFAAPVSRYIVGKAIPDACDNFDLLSGKGYRIGVEFVGEEISDEEQVEFVVQENIRFLTHARQRSFAQELQLGFDLSSVGMLIKPELAAANTARIAEVAAAQDASIVISMERTTHTGQILDVFHELAPQHANLGITVQAYLKRTTDDLPALLKTGRKIRLVKGVYDEHASLALPRGKELNERYVALASDMAAAGAKFSLATHDPLIVDLLAEHDVLQAADEIDALHGCNPDLHRTLKDRGLPCRITGVYGQEWLLHFLHRLAEHPPNLLQAVADYYDPKHVVIGERY